MFQNSRWPSFSRVVTQCNVWLQPVRHLGAIVLSVTSLNGSTHDWALAGASIRWRGGNSFYYRVPPLSTVIFTAAGIWTNGSTPTVSDNMCSF